MTLILKIVLKNIPIIFESILMSNRIDANHIEKRGNCDYDVARNFYNECSIMVMVTLLNKIIIFLHLDKKYLILKK